MGEKEIHIEFLWGKLKAGDHFEDLSINERITLRWVLNRVMWRGLGLSV
jgi:hypothetical protein